MSCHEPAHTESHRSGTRPPPPLRERQRRRRLLPRAIIDKRRLFLPRDDYAFCSVFHARGLYVRADVRRRRTRLLSTKYRLQQEMRYYHEESQQYEASKAHLFEA